MKTAENLVCWKCGTSLETVILPFRRAEVCPECDEELHVCRMCTYYDPHVVEACTEDGAEEVRNKERANFCDYFKPTPNAYRARDGSAARASREKLDTLFTHDQTPQPGTGSARKSLDDLFDNDGGDD